MENSLCWRPPLSFSSRKDTTRDKNRELKNPAAPVATPPITLPRLDNTGSMVDNSWLPTSFQLM